MKPKAPAVRNIMLCALAAGASLLTAASPIVAGPVTGKATATTVTPAGWKTFTPQGAGFSLAMPGEPGRGFMMTEETERNTGLATYSLFADGLSYDLTYFGISGMGKLYGIEKGKSMQEVFAKVMLRGAPDSGEYKVSPQKDAPVQGRRGSEGTVTRLKAKEASRVRIVIDGDRLIVASVSAPTAAALSNPKVAAFLNSLKFAREDAPSESEPGRTHDPATSLPIGWQTNKVDGTGFNFLLPNAHDANVLMNSDGFNFWTRAAGVTYKVFFPQGKASGVMDATRAGQIFDEKIAIYGKRGKLTDRQDAPYQDRPASSFTLTTPATANARPTTSLYKMLMVNGRLVTMFARAPLASELATPEIDLFFSGLKFTSEVIGQLYDPELDFTYLLPMAPEAKTSYLNDDGANYISSMFGGNTYMVSYQDEALGGVMDARRVKQIFDAKLAFYGKNGAISDLQDAPFQGRPAASFTLTTPATANAQPTTSLIRMVMENKRVITMTAKSPTATKLSGPEIDLFFDGLKFTTGKARAGEQ